MSIVTASIHSCTVPLQYYEQKNMNIIIYYKQGNNKCAIGTSVSYHKNNQCCNFNSMKYNLQCFLKSIKSSIIRDLTTVTPLSTLVGHPSLVELGQVRRGLAEMLVYQTRRVHPTGCKEGLDRWQSISWRSLHASSTDSTEWYPLTQVTRVHCTSCKTSLIITIRAARQVWLSQKESRW